MKHGGLLTAVLILILCSLLGLASVSAADLTNDTLDDFQGDPVIGEINNNHAVGEKNNGDCLYVSVNGNSYANATSWGSATNSLDWAIYLAKDNTTIYIDNGTYSGSANSKINIAKSVNIVGSANTVFDGLNKNYFFTIYLFSKSFTLNIFKSSLYLIFQNRIVSGSGKQEKSVIL